MADTRDKDLLEKETTLTVEIERLLPDFARSCRDSADVVIIHQDSFAADYQDEEYALFGKAMKFAGLQRSPCHRKEQRDAHHGESRTRTIKFAARHSGGKSFTRSSLDQHTNSPRAANWSPGQSLIRPV